MAQPTLLVDPQNSKIKFPLISSEFSESTIIQGFIEFCHYNTEIPVNNRLLDYCLTKPEAYDKQKTLQENIEIMKKHDVSYSIEAFNQLLDAVNKLNIIPLDMVHSVPSCLSQIRNLIDHMIESQNSLGPDFLTLYKNVLDTYSIDDVGCFLCKAGTGVVRAITGNKIVTFAINEIAIAGCEIVMKPLVGYIPSTCPGIINQ